MWIKYNSRSGTHNMYREYRDTNLNSAIDTLCKYTFILLLVNEHNKLSVSAYGKMTEPTSSVFFLLCNYLNLWCRQRHGWSPQIQKQEHPDHPYCHRGCQGLQESHHHTIPRKFKARFFLDGIRIMSATDIA